MGEFQVNPESEMLTQPEPGNSFRYFPFFKRHQPIFILVLLGIVFYSTSLYNEYALDDGIVIHQNQYVLRGVEGIPDILSSDVYESFYKNMCADDQLSGGRYRPLSVVSFAIEQQFIHPYRTGYYNLTQDLNQNGVIDEKEVNYFSSCSKWESNYEYNESVDLNSDGVVQMNECSACWDQNMNFHNDPEEDLNGDGVFNEVDCQVYGSYLRHFNNIWIYVLSCVIVYILLRNYFFRNNHDLAFLAALIFLVHPVHSEVVANVRGRDDMLSLLFIALTFLFGFKYLSGRNTGNAIVASIMFFLALLSKEYGMILPLVFPLAIYVFADERLNWRSLLVSFFAFLLISLAMVATELLHINSVVAAVSGIVIYCVFIAVTFKYTLHGGATGLMTGLFLVMIVYLGIRINAVKMATGLPGTEILNNPFVLATGEETFATKIFVLLKYFVLTVFPKTLVSDYSFNTIPYKHFADWDFVVSLLLHIGLIVLGIRLAIKRHIAGFAILFYVLFLLIAGNFIIGTGVMMLEANLYHATLGAAIAIAWFILYGLDKISFFSFGTKRSVLLSLIFVAIVLCGCKVWERNADWKNDVTLFFKDVNNAPHSVLVLGNAGARWIDLADTEQMNDDGRDSVKYNEQNIGPAQVTEDEVILGGYKNRREAAIYKGIGYLKHAVELHPRYVNGFLNLGLAYYKLGKDVEAIQSWKYSELLYPDNPYLRNYYMVFKHNLQNRAAEAFKNDDFKTAIEEYSKAILIDPNDADNWYYIGGVYYTLDNLKEAESRWKQALKINPDHEKARSMMKMIHVAPGKK